MRRCLPQSKTFKISGRFWHAQRLTAYVEPKDAPPEGRPKGRPGIPRPPHGLPRDAHGTPRASLKAAQGRPRRAKQSPKTPYTQCQGCAPPKSKMKCRTRNVNKYTIQFFGLSAALQRCTVGVRRFHDALFALQNACAHELARPPNTWTPGGSIAAHCLLTPMCGHTLQNYKLPAAP